MKLSLSMAVGIFGMVLVCVGAMLPLSLLQKGLFLVGALAMGATAVWEKQLFLVALEIVIILGTVLAFIPISHFTTAIIMMLASIIALAYLLQQGELKGCNSWVGAAGLLTLAIGFAYSHPVIYLVGGGLLFGYSIVRMTQGVQIAALWAILNAVFVAVTLYRLV